jgi:hypothetical protein
MCVFIRKKRSHPHYVVLPQVVGVEEVEERWAQ